MSVSKPYFLTVRQFIDDQYSEGGRAKYIKHFSYSKQPSRYIRPFLLIQKDVLELFNFIEPSNTSLSTYSYRIQELLVRTCIEVEANFKAIMSMNKYRKKTSSLDITDFYKVNSSHFLTMYSVKLPYWSENVMTAIRYPFSNWDQPIDPDKPWSLKWYAAYNAVKHDRTNSFKKASFENLIDAVCGLVILLACQYYNEDFSPSPDHLILESGWIDGFDSAIGDYFRVSFPRNLPMEERYDFNWDTLSTESNPFQKYDYDLIK